MLPDSSFSVKPDQFIGRQNQIGAYEEALHQSLLTGRMASFAVSGDWGIAMSSLLLKFNAVSAGPACGMLPVFLPASKDIQDYLHLAESLLDKFAEILAATDTMTGRIRAEVQNWELKRVKVGGLSFDRETRRFLSSGSSLLRHALAHAWRRFLKPTHFRGAAFFPGDLYNFTEVAKVALAIRDQFRSFGIEGINYSLCFSARTDYFSGIRSFAEPAVRFYSKLYLTAFTWDEINEYVEAVFGAGPPRSEEISRWLYEESGEHPYFLIIGRRLATHAPGSPPGSPERLWPAIFEELERGKFRTDPAHPTEKEGLLHSFATLDSEEAGPRQFGPRFQSEYFRRLRDRGVLVRRGRGRYKLHHPLFKLLLQGVKP